MVSGHGVIHLASLDSKPPVREDADALVELGLVLLNLEGREPQAARHDERLVEEGVNRFFEELLRPVPASVAKRRRAQPLQESWGSVSAKHPPGVLLIIVVVPPVRPEDLQQLVEAGGVVPSRSFTFWPFVFLSLQRSGGGWRMFLLLKHVFAMTESLVLVSLVFSRHDCTSGDRRKGVRSVPFFAAL